MLQLYHSDRKLYWPWYNFDLVNSVWKADKFVLFVRLLNILYLSYQILNNKKKTFVALIFSICSPKISLLFTLFAVLCTILTPNVSSLILLLHFPLQEPQPLEKWDGEYLAIDDGPMCPQRNSIYRSTEDIGTEDCLRLNVYVPQMVSNKI